MGLKKWDDAKMISCLLSIFCKYYNNEKKYVGGIKNNKRHGQGVYYYINWNCYDA